jgi:hypothetical protein
VFYRRANVLLPLIGVRLRKVRILAPVISLKKLPLSQTCLEVIDIGILDDSRPTRMLMLRRATFLRSSAQNDITLAAARRRMATARGCFE